MNRLNKIKDKTGRGLKAGKRNMNIPLKRMSVGHEFCLAAFSKFEYYVRGDHTHIPSQTHIFQLYG